MNESEPKPDWKTAPDWANYLAMDEDGGWTWFEDRPRKGSNYWYGGKSQRVYGTWAESLEKRL